ncbi:Uma2 family endonuclease [Nonomuraea insulae]|uniref:Uma2 family endonuclease n=1 Tax=Nonomuraea insulae TaxID=1616787 RepID=A0ABW1CHY4_9ACTN
MTAEAVIEEMTPPSLPDWVFPPPQGFVAEDLDHLPDLPAHTELIDGSLVFVSPQRRFHQQVIHRLHMALEELVPADHEVLSNMTVKLGPRQRPEPDLIVVGPHAPTGPDVTCFEAEDVVLAVEVVSRESELRDRERKPVLYAQAGIPHFWRIEELSGGQAVIFVFELDPATKAYASAGVHQDQMKLSVPFDIHLDLTTLYTTRRR